MAINFGLLNPQQQLGGPVGSVSSSSSGPNPLDSFGQGLLSGAQTGSNIASAIQDRAAQKQRMDQQEQLFPALLAQEQQKAAAGAMEMENKQAARRSAQEAHAAFQESYEKGMALMKKNDPAGYLDLQKKQAEIDKALAETSKIIGETGAKANETYTAMAATGANLMQMAGQGKTPEEQQRIYQQGIAMLPQTLRSAYPAQYDPNSALAMTKLGAEAQFKLAKEAEAKNATPVQKDLQRIGALTGKQALSPAEKIELEGLRGVQNARERGQQQGIPANQQVNVATTTDRLKETGKTANIASQNLTTLSQMEKLNDEAYAGKGAEIALKAKQFLNFIGAPVNDKVGATEQFNGLVRQAQLTAQTLLKGSSSDRDMEIVEQTGPQLNNTAAGRKMMISAAKYKAKMDIANNSFLNAYQNANNGSLDGADEAWNNYRQSRQDYNPKTHLFDSDGIDRKSWEPFLDPNYQAPTPQATGGFKEGETYRDANGNRAKYVNGKWEEV